MLADCSPAVDLKGRQNTDNYSSSCFLKSALHKILQAETFNYVSSGYFLNNFFWKGASFNVSMLSLFFLKNCALHL